MCVTLHVAVLLIFALQLVRIYLPALNPMLSTLLFNLPELAQGLRVFSVIWLEVDMACRYRSENVAS